MPQESDNRDDADSSATSTPRWVKLFGAVFLALIVLFVVVLVTGGHNPGRHTGAGDSDALTSHSAPA